MLVARLLRINARQARHLRRAIQENTRKDEQIEGLCTRLRRIQDDVELLALAIPREKRDVALGMVRDRHRIEDRDIYEEAG